MPFSLEICNICLQNCNNLKPINENGEDNIKFNTKLSTCIPELDWNRNYMICKDCIKTLNVVHDFRKMCLESLKSKVKNNEDLIYDSDTTLNNHGDDPDSTEEKYEINTNKENLKTEISMIDVQNNLCNSLLNKKFKTNRLKREDEAKSTNLIEVKCEYIQELICYHCDKKFCDKETLALHLNTEHMWVNEETYECLKIKETARDIQKNRHKCTKCLRIYSTAKVLKSHTLKCIGVLKLKGNSEDGNDDKVNSEEKPKIKRGRKALEKQIYQCHICNVIFSTKYLLSRHVKNVHATEKLFKCDMCSQKFASAVYLSAHKRYHSRERAHICSTCGKGFITASDLYHHEKIHANKRSYKCTKCPKAFNTSSDLHKHNICVHSDRSNWKYVCTYCSKRFPLKTNLDTHIKIHTNERNFPCHMCDKKFINRSVLLRHIETHSNVRLFRCNICNQEYKYKKSLAIHMAKVHRIGDAKIPERVKKFICHICPKSFYANNKLQKHIRGHTGEKPFVCNLCEMKFFGKPALSQHMRIAHSILFGILND